MLQVFCLVVAKIDLDVAYACMLQVYVSSVLRCFVHIFASVSFGCCIYLQLFSNVFQAFFASVSDACFTCFICLFFMLQLLYLDVLKVDRVSHIGCVWKAADGTDDV
jgi:hypothetical protein